MIKEQIEKIKKNLSVIEWDIEHNKTDSKNRFYRNLKKEYAELQKKLEIRE